ncbi:MAG: histidine kinase dimerization/phospho-acceptor domain-containing protein, partial [bacterium]
MKRTILFKMFAGFLVSILLMISLIFIFYFNTINKYYVQTSKKNLKNLCLSLKPNIKQMLNTKNNNKINDYLIQLKKQINTRITIIDKTGKVIADSDANAVNMENHIDRPEIGEALEGEIGDDIRMSDTIKEKMIYIAIPLKLNENDSIDYILRLSIYVDNIDTLLNKLKIEMLQVSFIVIGIFLIIVLFFYNKISTPIRTLTDASNEVAQGNFDIKIFLKNRDELKDLADNFNYMVMRMKELFNALSNQKEGLNTIIESLQVGLLVLDNQGIIKISNQKLKEIVGIDKVNGQLYWNVLRDFNLNRIIEEVKEKYTLKKEIVVDSKTYLCSTSYIANSEEIVIILSDITEIKRLEKIKKDFVVNVSHELKTPLTAIKGFVETLLEEEQDTKSERRHYLKIIDKHTNRLTNIID